MEIINEEFFDIDELSDELPYHLRCSINNKDRTSEIEIIVIDNENNMPRIVRIKNAYPLMGHPKTHTCCK